MMKSTRQCLSSFCNDIVFTALRRRTPRVEAQSAVVKAEKEKDARKRCKQAGTGKSHGGRKTGWEGVEQDSGVKIDFDLRPALEVSML
jgi:hypothetical protein